MYVSETPRGNLLKAKSLVTSTMILRDKHTLKGFSSSLECLNIMHRQPQHALIVHFCLNLLASPSEGSHHAWVGFAVAPNLVRPDAIAELVSEVIVRRTVSEG